MKALPLRCCLTTDSNIFLVFWLLWFGSVNQSQLLNLTKKSITEVLRKPHFLSISFKLDPVWLTCWVFVSVPVKWALNQLTKASSKWSPQTATFWTGISRSLSVSTTALRFYVSLFNVLEHTCGGMEQRFHLRPSPSCSGFESWGRFIKSSVCRITPNLSSIKE